jgi:hypothetical protein
MEVYCEVSRIPHDPGSGADRLCNDSITDSFSLGVAVSLFFSVAVANTLTLTI